MAANRKTTSGGGARRKPQGKARQAEQAPRWVWLMAGLVPGLFIALLIHLHHQDRLTPERADAGDDARDAESGDDQPRFEFYELLSEMEVVVPEREAPVPDEGPTDSPVPEAPSDPPAGAAPEPEPAPDDDDEAEAPRYVVQAGSFRSHEDADQLKARLALLGVQADIQSVEVDGGETWHRVRAGPYTDREQVERLRGRLTDEGVESILLRLRG